MFFIKKEIKKYRGRKEKTYKRCTVTGICNKKGIVRFLWETSNGQARHNENKEINLSTLIDNMKTFVVKGKMKTHSEQRFLIRKLISEIFTKSDICWKFGKGLEPNRSLKTKVQKYCKKILSCRENIKENEIRLNFLNVSCTLEKNALGVLQSRKMCYKENSEG